MQRPGGKSPLTGRLPGSRRAALEVQTRRFMAKGGANLDLVYDMVGQLPEHVEVVGPRTLVEMALQRG